MVLSGLNGTAIERLHDNTAGVYLYNSNREVVRSFRAANGQGDALAFYVASDANPRMVFGPCPNVYDAITHEFGHAIDGPDFELSDSQDWQEAWSDELSGGQLTEYAASKPCEGLATFAQRLYTGEMSLGEAEVLYPRCLECFQKWEII